MNENDETMKPVVFYLNQFHKEIKQKKKMQIYQKERKTALFLFAVYKEAVFKSKDI